MKSKETSLERRNFLGTARGLGLLGAAALLAGRGAPVSAAPIAEEAAPEPAGDGYRETERIRKYYDTLRRM